MFRRFSTKEIIAASKPSVVVSKVFEAEVLSGLPKFCPLLLIRVGVPEEVTNRSIRIYQPVKTAMQSGVSGSQEWKIDFDVESKWGNDLVLIIIYSLIADGLVFIC